MPQENVRALSWYLDGILITAERTDMSMKANEPLSERERVGENLVRIKDNLCPLLLLQREEGFGSPSS